MLLIGMPKSASTSLMWSISEILKIPHKNGQNKTKDDNKCEGYEELQKYHGTTVKRSKQYLEHWINQDIIYKEHILPTEKHLQYLNEINKPIVVLLRNPKDCIRSYKRVMSVLFNLKLNFKKLEEELKLFYDTYIGLTNNEKYKIIAYDDIVYNFTETMKEIVKHYEKEVPENIEKYELQKRNYTWSK